MPHSRAYLYPSARRAEILSACYAGGFGLFIGFLHITGGNPALYWTGLDLEQQMNLGRLLLAAALVHAVGVRVNGSWRWSPLLRLFGLGVHCGVFWLFAAWGIGRTSGYTYTWIAFVMLIGVLNAARDTFDAVRGEAPKWKTS